MSRLTEPSTWAGIAAFGQLIAQFAPQKYTWVGHGITGVAAAIAIALREKGGAQ